MKQSFHHFFSSGGENLLYPPGMEVLILVVENVLTSAECREIAQELSRQEKRLMLENPSVPIAGLSDSLTTRWLGYNVLTWDIPAVASLRKKLPKLYLAYLKEAGIPRWRNEIQCWGNILRKGEFLHPHCHNYLHRPALSMTLALADANTETVYQFPFPLSDGESPVDKFFVPTSRGNLIMVPGWVMHYTTPHAGSKKRITLGIDVASGLTKGSRIAFDDGKKFRL